MEVNCKQKKKKKHFYIYIGASEVSLALIRYYFLVNHQHLWITNLLNHMSLISPRPGLTAWTKNCYYGY